MKFATCIVAALSTASMAMAGTVIIREAVSPKAGIYVSHSGESIKNQDCPQFIPHVTEAPSSGVIGVFGNRYWANDTYFSQDGTGLFRLNTASSQKQLCDGNSDSVLGDCTESFGSPEICNDSTTGSKASSRVWYTCTTTD